METKNTFHTVQYICNCPGFTNTHSTKRLSLHPFLPQKEMDGKTSHRSRTEKERDVLPPTCTNLPQCPEDEAGRIWILCHSVSVLAPNSTLSLCRAFIFLLGHHYFYKGQLFKLIMIDKIFIILNHLRLDY